MLKRRRRAVAKRMFVFVVLVSYTIFLKSSQDDLYKQWKSRCRRSRQRFKIFTDTFHSLARKVLVSVPFLPISSTSMRWKRVVVFVILWRRKEKTTGQSETIKDVRAWIHIWDNLTSFRRHYWKVIIITVIMVIAIRKIFWFMSCPLCGLPVKTLKPISMVYFVMVDIQTCVKCSTFCFFF